MNREEYRIMYELEGTHWWYAGIRKIYFNLLNKFYSNLNGLMILDAGCGTGIMLDYFKKYGSPIGIDISSNALYFSYLRGHREIIRASVTELPFTDESFDLVSALSVIYHLQIKDDYQALKEFYRVLKKKGKIIIQVPAYNFLKSEHDETVYTRHRYTKGELKIKLKQVGFKIEKITYANIILFPAIALFRLIKRIVKIKGKPRSDLRLTPVSINKVLIFILTMEAKLLKIINFPFGLSILCIARK